MFGGPKDTRTKEQKLEAMANQSASPHEAEVARRKLAEHRTSHPIFARRHGGPEGWPNEGIDTDTMEHEDFMEWMRRASRVTNEPKPHMYKAYRGSDALGCETCGRSRDNRKANHIRGLV